MFMDQLILSSLLLLLVVATIITVMLMNGSSVCVGFIVSVVFNRS